MQPLGLACGIRINLHGEIDIAKTMPSIMA